MYPERSRHQQTGAGLPVALFIITVLALLVIGMAQLQESSGKAVSLQIQSQRAFFAAESGAQVVVSDLLSQSNGSPLACGPAPISTLNFASGGLAGCSSTLSCSEIGGGGSVLIESQGKCGGSGDLAERAVEVRLR